MRPIASTVMAFATLLPSVLAAGQRGFALGSNTPSGACKTTDDFNKDLAAIKSGTGSSMVRIYASGGQCQTAKNILPAAKTNGFKIMLGVWPDTDESLKSDTAALQTYVPQYKDQVYAVIVGSETLYRHNFTGQQLLQRINTVKSALPSGTKIGTADTWNYIANGTADPVLQGGIDIILANDFSYWQGASIDDAAKVYADDISQALTHVQNVAGSLDKIEFWNGETGWPSDGGSDYGAAKAGTSNAEKFYRDGFCYLSKLGINAFWFEAFDEPNKAAATGDSGDQAKETKWGAFNADRSPKYDSAILKCPQ